MNNRMHNAHNQAQGSRTKALCVCSAGLLRSPTLAWVLSNEPFNFNTRAAGSSNSFALIQVDEVLVHWADIIFFVNKENEEEVEFNFTRGKNQPNWADGKHIITLNIPDNFEFRDPVLVEIIKKQLVDASVKFKEQTGIALF